MIKRLLAIPAAVLAAALLIANAPVHHANLGNGAAHVTITPSGSHIIGNPAAPIKLTEYMSYTCSHCAAFENEGVGPMRLTYIANGKVSLEIRHLLRDPIDVTVAMLTNCVAPPRFMLLHEAFLHSQADWLGAASRTSAAQRERWATGDDAAKMRAIARDLKFYDIMERGGFSRVAIDHCLSDPAMLKRITAQSVDADKQGVNATPSFAIDGVLLAGTHTWDTLAPQLQARM